MLRSYAKLSIFSHGEAAAPAIYRLGVDMGQRMIGKSGIIRASGSGFMRVERTDVIAWVRWHGRHFFFQCRYGLTDSLSAIGRWCDRVLSAEEEKERNKEARLKAAELSRRAQELYQRFQDRLSNRDFQEAIEGRIIQLQLLGERTVENVNNGVGDKEARLRAAKDTIFEEPNALAAYTLTRTSVVVDESLKTENNQRLTALKREIAIEIFLHEARPESAVRALFLDLLNQQEKPAPNPRTSRMQPASA